MKDQALNISNLMIGYPQKKGGSICVAGPMDISIEKGELICLLGPNGVGKTTLLRTIAGIQPALDGGASILGKNISTIPKMLPMLKSSPAVSTINQKVTLFVQQWFLLPTRSSV